MNSTMTRPHSLKTRITLATLTFFLIGIWSLSFYLSRVMRDDMERQLSGQLFSTASMASAQVNGDLEIRLNALQRVASTAAPHLRDDRPELAQVFLENRTTLQSLFNGGLFMLDRSGRAVADFPLSSGRRGVDYHDRDYAISALRDGIPMIGQPMIGRRAQSPLFIMSAPIRNDRNEIVGAIAGLTNLDLPNFLDAITDSHYGKTGGYLLVAPKVRLVVTATDKRRVMEKLPDPGVNALLDRFVEGYEGAGININSLGVEVLAASKGIPVSGWYVMASLPTSEAFAPIREMQQRMLWATTLLSLLAVCLIWWMLKRELSPLLGAAKLMATMSAANQPPQPLPIIRHDEIGQLIGGFNSLLQALGQREALLKQILDTSSVAIFLVDMQGVITQANQRMAEMFLKPVEQLVGSEYVSLVHPAERETGRQRMLALLRSEINTVDLDRRYWRSDQTEFWGHLNGKRFYDPDGNELGLVGVIADIDVRKQAEEKLKLAASVFTHAREGILITNAEGRIIDVNEAFTRITGYGPEEVVGQTPRLFKSGHHDLEFYKTMWHDLEEKGHWTGEIWNRRKNGEVYVEMKTISAISDAEGRVQQYVALFSDITPIKEHEKQLEHIAHFDVLTTLPNRVLLADRLHQAMSQAQRRKQLLAVAYLDLDGFKAINDTYGHNVGDQLLVAVSARMKQTLREGDTLARLGGDEFVAVLLDLDQPASSEPMLVRLLAAAAEPVHLGELVLQVSASLGVTFYPKFEDEDADQLLRQADQAMYQAKLSGKNRFHVFDAEHDRNVRGRHGDLQRIHDALAANEFVLYFQPKVNMRTGKVFGAEALIRWQHPEKGLLSPALFLPVIENDTLAVDVGEWVIESALSALERWRNSGLDITVSVNVGARQLQQVDFVARLRRILENHPDYQAGDLEMEVLETSALEDLIRVSQVIKECRELGVTFALDDFGTGYSSLTYLKRLPVSVLKIDQSFVRDMLDDPDDLTILEGVISLAQAFNRQVIAEGVESVEQGEVLLRLGCELAQGYGIGRPMPAAEIPGWVESWRPDPEWKGRGAVSRENLPLLFACTEHRAWVVNLEKFLREERNAPPPLDVHQCRFGMWLDGEGQKMHGEHGASASLLAIEKLHEQLHALATTLCQMRQQGNSDEALERLHELHALRDALLQQLMRLEMQG